MGHDKLKEVLALLVTAARHPDTPATITTQLGEAIALVMEVLADETP